jgi:hypothetical protein
VDFESEGSKKALESSPEPLQWCCGGPRLEWIFGDLVESFRCSSIFWIKLGIALMNKAIEEVLPELKDEKDEADETDEDDEAAEKAGKS